MFTGLISPNEQRQSADGHRYIQGLKWGRVARVGDPAPFHLPGLYSITGLLFTLL